MNMAQDDLTEFFDALIFDCDGTLVDSMPTHYVAWTETLDRYGIAFPEERFYALGGVPATEIITLLAAEAGVRVNAEQLAAERNTRYEGLHKDTMGVEPVIAIARRHRGLLPMAVASGSCLSNVEQALTELGIAGWFDVIVAAEDVRKGKPAPDVFLTAASRLAVNASRCCAFEDTDLGMQAIKRAGMTGVDIRRLI
ncbi:MAG: HAD family phosphatase [Deltaproteobacteria bacterium]|nr:HAD family phosphatase [Deltaproteobacteria bacterium]